MRLFITRDEYKISRMPKILRMPKKKGNRLSNNSYRNLKNLRNLRNIKPRNL